MIGIEMPMPKDCSYCRFMVGGWCYAKECEYVYDYVGYDKRPYWCPLIDFSVLEDDLK